MKYGFDKIIRGLRRYYPPFRNFHFWAIQLVAIPIAAFHTLFESTIISSRLDLLYFVPIILLVIPVVYAALTFGFSGSIGTAIWVTVLTIPSIIWINDGMLRLAEFFQLGILLAMAIFMGQTVDRKNNSRSKIELANAALTASEMKYQSLFDSCPCPILILDKNNTVLDSNPAANILFGNSSSTLKGHAVNQLGLRNVTKLVESFSKDSWWKGVLVINTTAGSEVYLEPTYTMTSGKNGNTISQILLKDITEEHHRQARLKAYTAFILRAQEEERLHIARELHDETIQNLNLLCLQLDNAVSRGRISPEVMAKELVEARNMAEKVVKDLRNFTKALRPSILDDLGLVVSIRRLLVDFLDRTKIKGQLKVLGKERRLSSDAEMSLFRISQEALWNIEHHAKATNVNVNITFDQQETRLEVIDDGVGFNTPGVLQDTSGSEKLGLVGMQERAELCGGKLEIYSSPRKGTTISVTMPNSNSPRQPQPT